MQHSLLSILAVESTGGDGSKYVTVPMDLFNQIVTSALRARGLFDQTFYLDKYSDVKSALNAGQILDASDHYYRTGYFEGRLPKRILVDEEFYLEQNQDVRKAMLSGLIKNAQQHFEEAGFKEGRLPYRGFSLFPD